MGEIVSGVATAFLDKLATKAYQEISLACGLEGDVEGLRNSVRITGAYLMDAENRQTEKQSITEWLQQLKDAIYDATDILDEMEYEVKRTEVNKMYGSVTKEISRFFSHSNPLAFRLKMAHKIKDIKERMDKIIINGKNLGLTEQHAGSIAPSQKLSWRETGSFLPPRVSVTSRDEEKEEIISLLINSPAPSQSQVSNIDVIPIVGIGGLGKTTLSQMVYNDNRVVEHFKMRMWVCVSDEFDVKGLILKIIKAADKTERGVDHNSSLDELQCILHEKLHEERFLLVLDDVWNENAKKWDDLRNHLLGTGGELKSNGNKIIVTTRSHIVASIMGTVPQISLEPLPEEECWEIFAKCAFLAEKKEAEQYPRLKEIGKEIVKMCKGLPLAVTTLGCLLKSKLYDENEWKKIRDSELWKIDQKDDGILPALRLSYNHLPPHLKQCFSYCSIFPKDYQYDDIKLVSFWMAHGLLQPANGKEEPEHLGELYINQLVSASFFQIDASFEDPETKWLLNPLGIKTFKMHDLIHDLAMSTMQREREIQHLYIPDNGDAIHSRFPIKSNKIRTIGRWQGIGGGNTVKWISNKFKYLRVLDLQGLNFRLLPDDCFAKMKHLRYLDLSKCCELEKLPDSICKLHLLQSLFLSNCDELQELTKSLRNLISLRNLYISGQVTNLLSMDIGCLKFLQILVLIECINLVSLPRDMSCLTALKKLLIIDCKELASIEDDCEEEGKQNEAVKNLSLEVFVIMELPKLTALPNWLKRSAKTLRSMTIIETGLTALPEWLPNLTTLDTLLIGDCPQLLSLPNDMDRLHSLQRLCILECPLLVARCKKGTGIDWPKIAHVPHLKLDSDEESEDEEKQEEEEA